MMVPKRFIIDLPSLASFLASAIDWSVAS